VSNLSTQIHTRHVVAPFVLLSIVIVTLLWYAIFTIFSAAARGPKNRPSYWYQCNNVWDTRLRSQRPATSSTQGSISLTCD